MKNILFYFNWEFTELCHAFAINLRKKYGIDNFSGLAADIKDFNFLKKQSDIRYKHLYHVFEPYENYEDEEIDEKYLIDAEEKYGVPNLWLLIYADRDLAVYNKKRYSHDQYKKLVQRYLKFAEKIIDETKTDCILIDVVASLPSYALYAVAKKKGVKIRIITYTRTFDRMAIIDNTYDEFTEIFKLYNMLKERKVKPAREKEVLEFLKVFRSKKIETGYMASSKKYISENFSFSNLLGKFPKFFEYFYSYYFGYHKEQYNAPSRNPFTRFNEKFQRYFRKRYYQISGLFEHKIHDENYVFFPLHLEPEMATMVQAPMYIDQIPLIENISKSIPLTYKLYVKDHPLMLYFGDRLRPISYYERIKKIPNVRLLDPLFDSYQIIKNAKLVTTIGGTPGWEALILKKPVITFGKAFYNILEMVRKCDKINELPYLVKNTLKEYKHDEEGLHMLLDAIYAKSFGGEYAKLYGLERRMTPAEILEHKDFKNIFDYLCKKLGLEN